MMKSMMKRTTLRAIKQSLGRYIAILAIIALGVGFFCGLKITRPAMLSTASNYISHNNMFDFSLISSLGYDEDSVKTIKETDGIKDVEGSIEKDALVKDVTGKERTVKFISMPKSINKVVLKAGRMAKNNNECVADSSYYLKEDIGKYITVSDNNEEDTKDTFKTKKYKIVGLASTPVYLNYERGSSGIGDGTISSFVFIERDAFDTDIYSNIYVTVKDEKTAYSKAYDKQIKELKPDVKEAAKKAANIRYDNLVEEYKTKAKEQLEAKFAAESLKAKQLAAQQLAAKQKEAEQKIKEQLAAQQKAAPLQTEAEKNAAQEMAAQQMAAQQKAAQEMAAQEMAKQEMAAQQMKAQQEAKIEESAEKAIKKPKVFTLGRKENVGYVAFDNNADIVNNIAKVFPLFFFMVAALVCMTTMTRMVDEERTQIGVFKALGYSNRSILGKYLFYSGSAAALGAILGFFAGSKVFPAVIWKAYGMMYDFNPEIDFVLDWRLGFGAFLVALICSMGATWISCEADFRVIPAALIRPKAPKSGKRILLERVGFIWKHLSFLYKVSLRNIFRYKKRLFMMVLGIGGCTALIIAGLGIGTTIKNVAKFQYNEILNYDYAITFDKDMKDADQTKFEDFLGNKADKIAFLHRSSVDVETEEGVRVARLVSSDEDNIKDYIDLHSGSKELAYPKTGEAVVCKRFQEHYKLKKGDSINLKVGNDEMKVKIASFCDNYVYDYVYINNKTYEDGFGKMPENKTAYVIADKNRTDKEVRADAASCNNYKDEASIESNKDIMDNVEKMMRSLNGVIIFVIFCAGLLAFIVLYNLTNINITERIREIATIKVLGFYPNETSLYVMRENMMLTAMGALAGIPLGKWLLTFIVSQLQIDMIFYEPRITVINYIMAVALTFVFAIIVNLVMRIKLAKVNMSESLKAIE